MPTDMKELIAQAAGKLMFEKKVKKLTVTDIVEECHITRQTFYYHFEDVPHLMQWILERELDKLRLEALQKGDVAEQFRYFFSLCVQYRPHLERTLESSYGAEMKRMMRKAVLTIAEEAAADQHLYDDLDPDERERVFNYHCSAVFGLFLNWTDKDTEQVDEIAMTAYRIITGQIRARIPGDQPEE